MRTFLIFLLASGLAACETSDARTVEAEAALAAVSDEDTRVRRVWERAGDYGTPSPDGRLVTFVDWSTGDVAVYDISTGESRHVTDKGHWVDNGSWAEEPLFSPDGEEIAYTYGDVQAGVNPFVYQLRIVGVDGTGDRVVYQFPSVEGWISPEDWREDRGILVRIFPDEDRAATLSLLSPDDGATETIRTFRDEPGPRNAYFSPNGRFVAYRAADEVRILDLEGGSETVLDVAVRALMGWYDDGRALLVHTAREGVTGFWRIPVRGGTAAGEPELVRSGVPVVSPGGKAEGRFYYQIPVDGPKLHLASIDVDDGEILSQPVAVTGVSDGWAADPAWSPDGRWLAYFLRDQDRDFHLMLRSADGDRTMELTTVGPVRDAVDLTWTPDGSALHFLELTSDEEESILRRVDARSGETAEVLRAPMRHAVVTPDGRQVVLMREARDDRDRTSGLIVRDLATGEERSIHPGVSHSVSVSPDGRTVATITAGRHPEDRERSRLLLIPIEGGEPRVLAETAHPEHWEYNAWRLPWTRDGRFVLAVHGGWEGIPHHLMAVPVDGGEPRRFFPTPGSRIYPDIHPDGQRVAFIGGNSRSEMWVLEDLD